MSEANAFSRQLWKDFDWDMYVKAQLPNLPDEEERNEFKQCVEAARNIARLLQDGAVESSIKELEEYRQTLPPHLLFRIAMILAMVANVMYQAKNQEAEKLDFAIITINRLSSICQKHKITEARPLLMQFITGVDVDSRK